MTNITFNNKTQIGKETPLFISKWDTTLVGGFGKGDPAGSPDDTVVLPLTSDGSYDFYVDWGDGNRDNITGYNQSEITHQYSNTGIYEIRIRGGITGWQFNNAGDDDKILEISNWGPIRFTSGNTNIFYGSQFLDITTSDSLVLGNDASQMFAGCDIQNNLYANNWDTSACTIMISMFNGANSFNQNIGSWDISNVTSIAGIFGGCDAFNNGGSSSISGWNTSNITNMLGAFAGVTGFNQPIGTWDVSNVTTMQAMFREGAFTQVSFDQDLGNWDVSSVTSMNGMFDNTTFNNGGSSSISGWNTSSVTDMQDMFKYCTEFNQPIGSWDVSSVTGGQNFAGMFNGSASKTMAFNQDISNWDVSNATVFTAMFVYTTGFNQPIGNWTTTNMQYIGSMLSHCSGFDQDLSNWNVSNVTFATNFMNGTTLSTTNYDRTLSGWSSQSVNSLNISFGNSQYSTATGAVYRSALVSAGWTITDGGAV